MKILLNNKAIRILLPIMILVFLGQQSYAVQFRSKKKRSKVQSYPWGIQIALDEKGDDYSDDIDYQGIRFSLKRYTSKHTAARFNLGFYGHEIENRRGLYDFGDITIDLDDGDRFDFTGVNLSFQYLYYPSPDNKFQFFWGAGPRLSINDTDPQAVCIYYNRYYDYYEEVYCTSSAKLGLGIEAALGTEWFLSKNFSLLLEWGIILQNEWYFFEFDDDIYYNSVDNIEAVNDGIHLDASRAKLGVAFYF
jgi:hypothetical protein